MRLAAALCLGALIASPAFADEAALGDAVVLFDAGEYRDAVPLLQAVANDPEETARHRARAFLYLGLCQVALGDTDAAAGDMHEAYRLDARVELPVSRPPGSRALADEVRARLGLPALAVQAPTAPSMAPPPPLPEMPVDQASPGYAVAAPSIAAPTPPPPPAKKDMGPFLVGVDFLGVGFIGTQQVAPSPELELGIGDDVSQLALVLGLMLGQQPGYAEKLRLSLLGTSATPVGWNWTVDVGLVEATGPQGTVYFDASTSPINITWKVAPRFILEFRVIGVGYYLDLGGKDLSTWSLEGGLAARWLP